jgi:putative sterol carrier protein
MNFQHLQFNLSDTSSLDAVSNKILKHLKLPLDEYSASNLHFLLKSIYELEFDVIKARGILINDRARLYQIRSEIEQVIENNEKSKITINFKDLPENGIDFINWWINLVKAHPVFDHQFYSVFLKDKAKHEDFRYYLAQESTLDPRFDDILALIQVGIPSLTAKMELASNYWDEMGNGDMSQVHSLLFKKVLDFFAVTEDFISNNLCLEAIISGNLSSFLALYRANYYKAVGYFGVTEYLVPSRFKYFIKGCRRLGVKDDEVFYHKLHISIDSKHSMQWLNKVISKVAEEEDKTKIQEIVVGTLYRLNSSKQYLDYLMTRLS